MSRAGFFMSTVRPVGGVNPNSLIMTFSLGASDSITLPLINTGTYSFTVDWGDGTDDVITAWNQAERVHAYIGLPAGDYVVTITGTCTAIRFDSVTTSRAKLKNINQWGDTGFSSLGFAGATNIQYLPAGLKMSGSMTQTFQGCNLTSAKIDPNLFSNSSGIGSIAGCFLGNPIVTIPFGLLYPLVNLTNAGDCFDACGLTSIHVDTFRYNTLLSNMGIAVGGQGMLARNNLTSIPADLFRYNTACTRFDSTFRANPNLNTIPSGLFQYNTNVTNFNTTFFGCPLSGGIPVDIFRYNTLVNTMGATFQNASALPSLPVDLFRYNTAVTTFSSVFSGCSSLVTDLTDVFKYNTLVNNFSSSFASCINITSINVDAFRFNTAVTTFQQAFQGARPTSLPADLFRYNTSATNFAYCLSSNPSLTAIPSGLFQYNTSMTNASGTFQSCNNLTSVPSGLFTNNTSITIFGSSIGGGGLFEGCTSLTSIPTSLFNTNINVTNYSRCFSGCTALNISVTTLVSGIDMTKVTSTNMMFNNCVALTGNGQSLIDKPKAAGYTVGTATNTGSYRTFFNCTALTDFATISANYK